MVLQLTTVNPARVKTFAKKILAVDVKAGKKLFHKAQRCPVLSASFTPRFCEVFSQASILANRFNGFNSKADETASSKPHSLLHLAKARFE
jgi:hypothetical protein